MQKITSHSITTTTTECRVWAKAYSAFVFWNKWLKSMVEFTTVFTNSPVCAGLCCLVIKSHVTSVHHLLLLQDERKSNSLPEESNTWLYRLSSMIIDSITLVWTRCHILAPLVMGVRLISASRFFWTVRFKWSIQKAILCRISFGKQPHQCAYSVIAVFILISCVPAEFVAAIQLIKIAIKNLNINCIRNNTKFTFIS